MELIPVFDPTMSTSGSFVASTLQSGSQMIINNKSYVNMIFTFSSGDQRTVLANDRRAFTFGGASSVPGPNVKWEQESIDYPQTINQLQNLVYIEIYAPTEVVSEKYPAVIQRETLPSLVPYDIGYTSTGLFSINSSTPNPAVWPSSYYGVTVAPVAIQGMAFDHLWVHSTVGSSPGTMFDVPGSFPSTGKTANNAIFNNPTQASNVPGPFSKPGLVPVDSATFLNGAYWSLVSNIVWPTTFYIDFWVYMTNFNTFRWLLGDNVIAVGLGAGGNIFAALTSTGSGQVFTFPNPIINLNEWTYVSVFVNAGVAQLFVNGVMAGSIPFTGTLVAPTEVMGIGGLGPGGFSNVVGGSIANIGVLLGNIMSTPWGQNTIAARYELGLQSLNVNMQKVWITGVDYTAFATVSSTAYSTILLDNIFAPGGLLFVDNSANTDPLHIINPFGNTLQWRFPSIAANTINSQIFKPTNPITHLALGFPQFIVTGLAANTQLDLIVHGYNILGIK